MAYRVLYRKRVERDLNTPAKSATLEWFDGLCEAVESLAEFPNRCPFASEPALRRKGVRRLLFGEGRSAYHIFCLVKDETVQILTIRHTRRRPLER